MVCPTATDQERLAYILAKSINKKSNEKNTFS
jgi:hypothetical protein